MVILALHVKFKAGKDKKIRPLISIFDPGKNKQMIGIFDSGAGGMSVFREIHRLLPHEVYTYFADNANCPYGERSAEFVLGRSREITEFLLGEGADVIVIACNTATAAAISTLRSEYPNKFIGIEPALKPGALNTRSGIVGVLATAGTLQSTKYLVRKEGYDSVRIVESVGRGWVDLVENGILEGPEAERRVQSAVQPLLDAGADCLVLGCTHYPFLIGTIRKVAGPAVQIIDPAPAVARQVVRVMLGEGLISADDIADSIGSRRKVGLRYLDDPDIELISSGDPEPLERIYKLIFP